MDGVASLAAGPRERVKRDVQAEWEWGEVGSTIPLPSLTLSRSFSLQSEYRKTTVRVLFLQKEGDACSRREIKS